MKARWIIILAWVAMLSAACGPAAPTLTPTTGPLTATVIPAPSLTPGVGVEATTALETPGETAAPPSASATAAATERPTLPASTPSATAAVSGTAAATPPPSISAGNAVSVTALARFGPGLAGLVTDTVTGTVAPGPRLDQVVWGPSVGAAGAPIAVAGAVGVQVYDRATGLLTLTIDTSAWATTLAFSGEGRTLAAGTANATVEVYDARTGELQTVLGGPAVRVEQVRYLPVPGSVLPAGYAVVSLGANNVLHFWDVALHAYLGPLDPGLGAVHTFDLSPRAPLGQQWLAVAAGSVVKVWALPALLAAAPAFQAVPATLELAQPAPITSLALSADGRWLAVGNTGGTVRLWDLAAEGGATAQTLDQQAAPAERLAFSPEGGVLASAHGDRLIRLWAVGGGSRALATLAGHADRVTSIAFSPDGRELASTGWEGLVRVWGLAGP